jgi:hypothetical protein
MYLAGRLGQELLEGGFEFGSVDDAGVGEGEGFGRGRMPVPSMRGDRTREGAARRLFFGTTEVVP